MKLYNPTKEILSQVVKRDGKFIRINIKPESESVQLSDDEVLHFRNIFPILEIREQVLPKPINLVPAEPAFLNTEYSVEKKPLVAEEPKQEPVTEVEALTQDVEEILEEAQTIDIDEDKIPNVEEDEDVLENTSIIEDDQISDKEEFITIKPGKKKR